MHDDQNLFDTFRALSRYSGMNFLRLQIQQKLGNVNSHLSPKEKKRFWNWSKPLPHPFEKQLISRL